MAIGKHDDSTATTSDKDGGGIGNGIDSAILAFPRPPSTPESALAFMHDLTSRADVAQANVLTSILRRNAGTEYLRDVVGLPTGPGGGDDDDLSSAYKRVAPVTSYEDMRALIRRIGDGDTSPILCADPISEFLARCVLLSQVVVVVIVIVVVVACFLTFAGVVACFLTFVGSSGTSGGQSKLLPATEEDWDRKSGAYALQMPLMSR